VATATASDYLRFAAGAVMGMAQGMAPFASFIDASAASKRSPAVQVGWGLGEMAGGLIQAFLGSRGGSTGGPAVVPSGGAAAIGSAGGAIEASVAAAEAQGWALFSQAIRGGGGGASGGGGGGSADNTGLARKFGLNASSPTSQQILNNVNTKVSDFISQFRSGSLRSVFPAEYLDKTVGEALTEGGSTVRKLLVDSRFAK
jgi:hypothetical protein